MNLKNNFKAFFTLVISPIMILIGINITLIYYTLCEVKGDDLEAYKHVFLQRMEQHIISNFLGVNTLSITASHVNEPARAKEIKEIFDIITVNGRYPYMAALKLGRPIIESFNKGAIVALEISDWHPILLKNAPNSFYRYILTKDKKYVVELRKTVNLISTVVLIDFTPFFYMIKDVSKGVEFKVSYKDTVIFKSDNFTDLSPLKKGIEFYDNKSQLRIQAQYTFKQFFKDYGDFYFRFLAVIVVFIYVILLMFHRSVINLDKIVKLNNVSGKKEKTKQLWSSIKSEKLIPGLIKNVMETLIKKDQRNDGILSSNLSEFHNIKNITSSLWQILKDKNISNDLSYDEFILLKREISRLNIKAIDSEKNARDLLNDIDENQTALIDLGLMVLDTPQLLSHQDIYCNSSEKSFYGCYVSVSKKDLSIIIDCIIENAIHASSKIEDPLKKEIEIEVFREDGLSCVAVYNLLPKECDKYELIKSIQNKIGDKNNRWTTKVNGFGGQGIRSIADLTVANDGQVNVYIDEKGRFCMRVGFPIMTSPFWAVDEFLFFEDDYVVVIDDDNYFLDFFHEYIKDRKIKAEYYDNLNEGIIRVTELRKAGKNVHLLCDNRYTGSGTTGIDAIKKYYHEDISILITGDMLSVEKDCCDNGIKYLSKSRLFADFPIKVISPADIRYVNIDDDPLGTNDLCLDCKRFDSFTRISMRLNKQTPIFMDYMLNPDDWSFEDRLKWLEVNGFLNITLHSGSAEFLENKYGHLKYRILKNKNDLWKEFEVHNE